MRKFTLFSTMLVLCGLPATAALAYLPTDGGLGHDRGPYAYLFERPAPAVTADERGPFAYLFERDLRGSSKAEADGGPYAYLFARESSDRG
jgi:hypothetical protein